MVLLITLNNTYVQWVVTEGKLHIALRGLPRMLAPDTTKSRK